MPTLILRTPMLLLLVLIFATTWSQDHDIHPDASYAFSLYQQIHRHPELGKKELVTAELIRKELKAAGFKDFVSVPELPTAVIAILNTGRGGRTIGLRAEMDARPGREQTGLPYASLIDTAHHSCGHDAHAAMLVAAARHLIKNPKGMSGRIVFLFQPAEEIAGGADEIINSKLLDSLQVSALYALHAATDLPVGVIGICPGFITARSTSFSIFLNGKSSHAAMPYMGDDMPLVASQLVLALANLPARKLDISMRPCVISPSIIRVGGTATNVLAGEAMIKGTIRSYELPDSTFNNQPSIKSLIGTTLKELCNSKGITDSTVFGESGSPTLNDLVLFTAVMPHLRKAFSGKIDESVFRSMAAEDFALYTLQRPCLYFSWGVSKDDYGRSGVHTSSFSIHPDAFLYGVELLTDLAKLP